MIPSLTGEVQRFWTDASVRLQAFQTISDAYASHDLAVLRPALTAVDRAIASGMAALGFPRSPVTAITIESMPGLAGVKQPDCHLRIGIEDLRHALVTSVDEAAVTWLHESVHGRHGPWRTSSVAAWQHAGYEEGLAEGIAHLIAQRAGFAVPAPLYAHYLRSYEVLAACLQRTPEHIFRRLWQSRHDQIDQQFHRVVVSIARTAPTGPMSPVQRGKLLLAAQELFATDRYADAPDDGLIRQTWETAL